jgi:hypothetical protein
VPGKHDQRAGRERTIAGLLLRADDDAQRHLLVLGVEVAGHRHVATGIVVEEVLEEQAQFEGLPDAPNRGEEVALCPPANRLPLERTKLLPRNRRRERRAQVDVDDNKRVGVLR